MSTRISAPHFISPYTCTDVKMPRTDEKMLQKSLLILVLVTLISSQQTTSWSSTSDEECQPTVTPAQTTSWSSTSDEECQPTVTPAQTTSWSSTSDEECQPTVTPAQTTSWSSTSDKECQPTVTAAQTTSWSSTSDEECQPTVTPAQTTSWSSTSDEECQPTVTPTQTTSWSVDSDEDSQPTVTPTQTTSWSSTSEEDTVAITWESSDNSDASTSENSMLQTEGVDHTFARLEPRKNLHVYIASEVQLPRTTKKLSILTIQRILQEDCLCGKKCIDNFGLVSIKKVRKDFWTNSRSVRMGILTKKVEQSKKKGHFTYIPLSEFLVCSKAFLKLLDINKNTMSKARAIFNNDEISIIPKSSRKCTKQTVMLMTWMEEYVKFNGESMPNKQQIVLPYGTRQRAVYEQYRRELEQDHCVQKSQFYKIWKNHFPHVKARKTNTFTKCTTCSTIERQIAKTTNPHTRAVYRRKKDEHNQRQMLERKYYYSKKENSVRHPTQYLSLIIDGMDQAKTNLPHFTGRQPKCINPADLMKTHVTGVINHGSREFSTYLSLNEYPSDPNLTINILLKTLRKIASRNGDRLPSVLFLQADNCFRENKNRFVLSLCEILVRRKIFMEVHLSFLPVGHTHEDIDAKFSEIAEKLRTKDAETIFELMTLLPSSERLKDVFDFKTWILPYLNEIKMISKPLHFKFTNNDDTIEFFYKGSHNHEWIMLEPLLRGVPNSIPEIIKPDFSKIDLDKQSKQIENMRILFKEHHSFCEWQTLYQNIRDNNYEDISQPSWPLDLLPTQTPTGFTEPDVIPEVRELIQKETVCPRVYVKKRHAEAPHPTSNDTGKKKKTQGKKIQGGPKQKVVYFYTDYRKRRAMDIQFLQLMFAFLHIYFVMLGSIFINQFCLCKYFLLLVTQWQTHSLYLIFLELFQRLLQNHLQNIAFRNSSLDVMALLY